MKKFDLGMGDHWRTFFKRMMWFSVVIFEIGVIILSILLSQGGGKSEESRLATEENIWMHQGAVVKDVESEESGVVTEGERTGVLVIGIIIGTVLNECFHSLWACLVYMFDDIARNRVSNERILELLEKQYSRQVVASSGYSDGSEKKILSVTQRIAVNHNPESAPKELECPEWKCPECGRMNPIIASFCKDCGHYK